MSQAEAEKYIADAGQIRNVPNARGKIIQPAVRYLRHNEREKRKEEAKRIKEMLEPMNIQLAKMGAQSVAQARNHLNALEEDLELHSPPTDLSGETRDAILREIDREEAIYREGLLSHEEMRRNHVGSVDRHLRHSKANKDRALKLKNLYLLAYPDSDEQDLCNLEKLRPSGIIPGSAQHYDSNAQISGHFAMSAKAKENWPENMPEYGEVNSPYKHALERENQELREKLAILEGKIELVAAAQKDRRLNAKLREASPKNKGKYKKREAGEYRPWICEYVSSVSGRCGKEFDLRLKGVHLASHVRMERDVERMEEHLAAIEAAKTQGA